MQVKHVKAAGRLRENVVIKVETTLLIRVDEHAGWIEEAVKTAGQHDCRRVDFLHRLMKQA